MKRANGVDDVDGNPAKKLCVSERAGRAPGPLATLLGAIRDGDASLVEAALHEGASANTTTTEGDSKYLSAGSASVLISAIARGHNGIVKLLLELGADPNLQCSTGETPLILAAAYKRREVNSLGPLVTSHGPTYSPSDPRHM